MTCIMVIDDDELFVKTMEIALKNKGFEVISALSGAEGLNNLETAKPDLILLDIMMHGMDGFETLQKIGRDKSLAFIPVIILTIKDQTKDILTKKGELGFADYLIKPFLLEDLYSKISKALQS